MRKSQGIAFVLCHFVLVVVASAATANWKKPNIIFFLVDDYDKPETSVHREMGPARSIKTKEWNYIALRYTRERIEAIRTEHRSVKQLMGLRGGVSRAKLYPHAFDPHQLYNLVTDPAEWKNVATQPNYRHVLDKMKRLLKQELAKFPDRPFGEFIPGGNPVGLEGQTGLAEKLRRFAARTTK